MNHDFEKINSKLLLFGEYTILLDSSALAIPYTGFTGSLDFLSENSDTIEKKSHQILRSFIDFLKNTKIANYFHLDNLCSDLDKGLYFLSNIPQKYGLGSSGALCAALVRKYGINELGKQSYSQLKQLFSSVESFFHGKSSGIDPIVIYLNAPLLFEKDNIKKVKIPWGKIKSDGVSIFLLDTQNIADTAPLVNWFTSQLKVDEYKNELTKEYLFSLEKTINEFLNFNPVRFKKEIQGLSMLQLKLFRPMIPKNIQHTWTEGLINDNYYLKLCGSGGGGFILGFSFLTKEELSNIFRNKSLKLTYIL